MAEAEGNVNVAPVAQRIIVNAVTGIQLHIQPFKVPENRLNVGQEWKDWLEDFEEEGALQKVQLDEDWIRCLRRYAGREVRQLATYLPEPAALPDNAQETGYEKLKRKLNDHFIPKKNKQHARYLFNKETIQHNESITAYAARLREKAVHCDFQETLDDRILEHIIQNISDKDLIKKAIQKKWNLDQFIEAAAEKEDITNEVQDMKQDHRVAKVGRKGGFKPFKHQGARPKKENYDRTQVSEYCEFCGQSAHAAGDKRACPAYGRKCRKCNRYNHFASCCKTEEFRQRKFHKSKQEKGSYGKKKQSVKAVVEDVSESSDSDDSTYFSMKNLSVKYVVKRNCTGASDNTAGLVQVRINNVDAWCEPDSGATANIMDEYQFRALRKRTEKLRLHHCQDNLSTIQGDLKVKGEFHADIKNATRGINTKFVVIKGHMKSPPLISRQTLEDLGMLLIDPSGRLKEKNEHRIRAVKAKNLEQILEEYKDVFNGIGCVTDPKSGKPLTVRLEMDSDAQPVAQKARHVPYYLKGPLKKWLKQGEDEGIFEKVPVGEVITWCSPLVVQPKPKYTDTEVDELEPHMIRASIDMRVPNTEMKRSRCVEAPILDDFTYHLHDCRIFSKMDLKSGYHQLSIDEDTSTIGTFSTPWGNYRPKRLMFGAKSSQDVFDDTMQRIFGDIPRCMLQRDDILVGGRDETEHQEVVRQVLERARSFNIKFNKDKCEFGKKQISFFGHIFTHKGLEADPEKIRAVQECGPPASKEEVRSLLGMSGYLSGFIEGYAAMTEPLRRLTHKDSKFNWGREQEKAFKKIKDAMSNARTMTYFDPRRSIIVRTEASFNEGLSAGLFQKTEQGLQPVHFISRTLKDPERRYSQTEKDALAIRWALERLRIYLTGAPKFKIITGHKPLVTMLNKPTAKLPPRIEKWVMELQDMDFEVEYQPGKDEADPLDYLSRHPLPETGGKDRTEKVIKWITKAESAITLEKIREETKKDPTLEEIQQYIQTGKWKSSKGRIAPYYIIRDELSIIEGLIYRERRLVIPENLQRKLVSIGHKMGHLGATKTKQMLRERYWFPEMTTLIDNIVGGCYECKITAKGSTEEPIKPTKIPKKAWNTVAVDYGGPYPDGHYNLVMVDKRSRYPVVAEVPSTRFEATQEKMKGIFATYGTPRTIESDNGPPFNGKEFAQFAEEEGFKHHRITPLHPRANGQAENFMRLINKTEQIANIQGKTKAERRNAIQEMLVAYRATPHPATNVTPYEAMKNREMRTKLDYEDPEEERNPKEEEIDQRDAKYKKNMKRRENKNTQENVLVVGDFVLLRQNKKNKWTTAYEPTFYTVVKINGSQVTARRVTDGRIVCRDASQYRLCNTVINSADDFSYENESEIHVTPPEFKVPARRPSEVTEPPEDVSVEPSASVQSASGTSVSQIESVPRTEGLQTDGSSAELNVTIERPNVRPQRNRKRPAYLKDYVCGV
jgi:hypothetical protein